MTRLPTLFALAAFVLAALASAGAGLGLAVAMERHNARQVAEALNQEGIAWADLSVDGLRLHLAGSAPTEAARLRALQVAGGIVRPERITDDITVSRRQGVVAPVFRLEVMRNHDDISIIGLVPLALGEDALIERLQGLGSAVAVAEMIQTSDHAIPPGWEAAVDFAIAALGRLPVAQVSVTAGRIEVHALVESAEMRERLTAALRADAPRGAVLALDLVAPRPVIAPFAFRLSLSPGAGARLESCAADSETARDRILRAVAAAGVGGRPVCAIGIGAPTPRWDRAVEIAVQELAGLGAGLIAFSDADVLLEVPHDVAQSAFDRAVARLETQLPDVFTLSARRLDAPEDDGPQNGPVEFVATLSAEGGVLVTGRLPDTRIREAVSAFARARFGSEAVTMETRLYDGLPGGWSVRVLTGLEALAELHSGEVVIQPALVRVTGVSGNPDASSQVTRILADTLGADGTYRLDIRYDESLDPVAGAPTPESCEAAIAEILSRGKITFAPGSATLDSDSRAILDEIAEVLRDCGELELEVAGHTDSQGREETNQRLSQSRAEAVVNALMARRVLVSGMVPRGYGPSMPIADNSTEAGREANRRIEFRLIRPEPEAAPLDPALEAELEFEPQPVTDATVRPRARPARPSN